MRFVYARRRYMYVAKADMIWHYATSITSLLMVGNIKRNTLRPNLSILDEISVLQQNRIVYSNSFQ